MCGLYWSQWDKKVFNMIKWIKEILINKDEEDEVSRIISYYNKRLMNEMEERKNFERNVFEKMCKYRDKLIEHGLADD